MTLEEAQESLSELLSALSTLADEYSTSQSPSFDDQGDLDFAVSLAAPAFELMTEALRDLFEKQLEQLEPLQRAADLDEIMSLLGQVLECEPAEQGASAAGRLLYFIQKSNYGVYSDPHPDGGESDVAGDIMLLEQGLDAILAQAPDDEDDDEDDDDDE